MGAVIKDNKEVAVSQDTAQETRLDLAETNFSRDSLARPVGNIALQHGGLPNTVSGREYSRSRSFQSQPTENSPEVQKELNGSLSLRPLAGGKGYTYQSLPTAIPTEEDVDQPLAVNEMRGFGFINSAVRPGIRLDRPNSNSVESVTVLPKDGASFKGRQDSSQDALNRLATLAA